MAENLFAQEPWARRGEALSVSPIGMSELPIGAPVPWPVATAPAGWLICDGAAVPAGCPILTSLYGANLPNLKGRVIVGFDASQTEFDTLGETGGFKTHTLVEAEMPSHDHTFTTGNEGASHNHGFNNTTGEGGTAQANRHLFASGGGTNAGGITTNNASNSHTHSGTTDGHGSDVAHNNLQPYRVFNYIVKAA